MKENQDEWRRVNPPVKAVKGKRAYLILAVQEQCGLKVKAVPEDTTENAPERVLVVGQDLEVLDPQALDRLRALVGRARAIRPRRPPPVLGTREPSYLILLT